MLLMFLEALGALALLIFMVWWTMFSGRRRGERGHRPESGGQEVAQAREPTAPRGRDG